MNLPETGDVLLNCFPFAGAEMKVENVEQFLRKLESELNGRTYHDYGNEIQFTFTARDPSESDPLRGRPRIEVFIVHPDSPAAKTGDSSAARKIYVAYTGNAWCYSTRDEPKAA